MWVQDPFLFLHTRGLGRLECASGWDGGGIVQGPEEVGAVVVLAVVVLVEVVLAAVVLAVVALAVVVLAVVVEVAAWAGAVMLDLDWTSLYLGHRLKMWNCSRLCLGMPDVGFIERPQNSHSPINIFFRK